MARSQRSVQLLRISFPLARSSHSFALQFLFPVPPTNLRCCRTRILCDCGCRMNIYYRVLPEESVRTCNLSSYVGPLSFAKCECSDFLVLREVLYNGRCIILVACLVQHTSILHNRVTTGNQRSSVCDADGSKFPGCCTTYTAWASSDARLSHNSLISLVCC